MPKSRIFFFLCLSFIGGIFLNSFWQVPQLFSLGILILGTLLISVLWRHKQLVLIGFCLLLLLLGVWQEEKAELRIVNNQLEKYNSLEGSLTFLGTVGKEVDVRENNLKLTLVNIEIVEEENRRVEGKILVTADRYAQYQYGDRLRIRGQLERPMEFPDFDYQGYLAKDGIYSVSYYPEIELVGKGEGNFIYSGILSFKDKLRESIQRNFSLPQSSILGAVILGDKRQISEEWKGKLNYAGVRHLTAVSGMHVAILTTTLMSLLIGLGLWQKQAFFLTIILITFFIIMTGLQSSAIRAGIMGSLFLLAQYLGRGKDTLRAIVLAGGIMLLQNPMLLKSDVGFQLSFLAMLGMNYFLPILRDWFRRIPNSFQIRDVLSMTLAAQIFTLPILIYNFGYVSLIAPLTNLLIVPLLPIVMGLGFISAIAGLVWQALGWFFSLLANLFLTYLVRVVDWFSSFSWSVYVLEISWVWLLAAYLVLGFTVWQLNKRRKLKNLEY